MTKRQFIISIIIYWLIAIAIWVLGSFLFFVACFACPSATVFLLPEIIGTAILLLIFCYLSKFQYEKYKGNISAALNIRKRLFFLVCSILVIAIILSLIWDKLP